MVILSGAKTADNSAEGSASVAAAPREEVNIEDIADDIPF